MPTLSTTFFLRLGAIVALAATGILLRDAPDMNASIGAGFDPDERFVLESNLPTGQFSFEILEQGSRVHLPSRLYFAHADGRPEVPVVGRFQNFLVTATGRELKTLPAGEYDVYVTRGTEYTLDHQKVSISEGQRTHQNFTLSRVVDTSGFISSDFHMHLTFAMRDGAIVSAAEGLDLLTATDHNVLKDYAPHIRELNLEPFLSSVVGAEIDTVFGHFNSFPLSVNIWAERTFRHAIRTPGEFLRLVLTDPGDEIVQINHPRGNPPKPRSRYFDARLNPETSEIEYPYFEYGFDQVEIFNAKTDRDREKNHYGRTPLVDQKLKDWYSLMNRGIFMTGVANTDAHGYPRELPGYPRNYVLSETDNPWEIDPARVVDALKSRASTASFGPVIRFSAGDGSPVGSQLAARQEGTMLHIQVQAVPWVPVERVELIANGKLIRTFPVENRSEVVRFDQDVTVRPEKDTWYVVLATSDGRWDAPFSHFSSFSFTNPILLDVDGNGYFDPPDPGDPGTPPEPKE
jgi:hypothetical protein